MSVGRRRRPHAGRTHRVSRYDLLLGLLPIPLLVGTAVSTVSSLSPTVGVSLGGLLSGALLAYGLFYDPPAEPRSD